MRATHMAFLEQGGKRRSRRSARNSIRQLTQIGDVLSISAGLYPPKDSKRRQRVPAQSRRRNARARAVVSSPPLFGDRGP